MLTVAKFEKENYCVCVSTNTGVLHHACRINIWNQPSSTVGSHGLAWWVLLPA